MPPGPGSVPGLHPEASSQAGPQITSTAHCMRLPHLLRRPGPLQGRLRGTQQGSLNSRHCSPSPLAPRSRPRPTGTWNQSTGRGFETPTRPLLLPQLRGSGRRELPRLLCVHRQTAPGTAGLTPRPGGDPDRTGWPVFWGPLDCGDEGWGLECKTKARQCAPRVPPWATLGCHPWDSPGR